MFSEKAVGGSGSLGERNASAGINSARTCRNVKRFRGGLVFKAHRLLYHSTLGWRVIKKKEGIAGCTGGTPASRRAATPRDRAHPHASAFPSSLPPAASSPPRQQLLRSCAPLHPGGNPGANLRSISHRCHPMLVAFVWELAVETIDLPLGCLQGGWENASQRTRRTSCWQPTSRETRA